MIVTFEFDLEGEDMACRMVSMAEQPKERSWTPLSDAQLSKMRDEELARFYGEYAASQDKPQSDPVNHPSHYTTSEDPAYEVIKVLDAWGLNFCRSNAIKYLARADYKGNTIQDLEKAGWYIQHEIETLTKKRDHG